MSYKSIKVVFEAVVLLYGAAIVAVDRLWASDLLPLGWIAPAFFVLYDSLFVGLMGRYERMKPERVVLVSMVMRGVKFLAVAAMMFVWVLLALPAKSAFLIYLLGYYLLSSLFEGWSVSAYNKEKQSKQ
ncbi:MAG: hypothetical protein J6K24_07730 [Tidjanibacter sp.]|nr:hypothetical protein [Tidjanibacter sp.]